MATDAARREPYIGEKRKFLRDGYGVYVYENQFFRYEGEWKSGKKHGHGKLTMKDGTYYEGQFVNGEINGHGFKFFSGSKCKYTGQFLNGELHGHGVMQYSDSSIYEGQWHKNKKQGFGILRTSSKAVYEGTFEFHHKNGEGTQTYDNGDRYEGYWVMDQRHGHGELICADGTYYVGQFANDMFHGDGKMQHASGMLYVGQWLHGFPSRLATKMVIMVEESPMIIRQGQPFKIAIKCQDDEGNDVLEDQGRELQMTAGFKYFPPKQGSVLFDMIEDVEEKPIPTPFGYEVVSYPLTDQLSEEEVIAEDEKPEKAGKDDDGEDKGEGEGEAEGGEMVEGGEMEEDAAKEGTVAGKEEEAAETCALPAEPAPPVGSNPPSPSQEPNPDALAEPNPPTQRTVTPVEATPLPPPVPTQRTEAGYVEWTNVQLSPPPPLYRPFVAMDEEKKSNKKMSLKDKFEPPAPSPAPEPERKQRLSDPFAQVRRQSRKSEAPRSAHRLSGRKSVFSSRKSVVSKEHKPEVNIALQEKRGSQAKLNDNKEKTNMGTDEKFARTDDTPEVCTEKEPKVEVKKFWKRPIPGEYVLMVHDVTTPPFLGKRLEPAFLLLKLKRPKKIIVKKPKWDTQRHIAAAMQARVYNSALNV